MDRYSKKKLISVFAQLFGVAVLVGIDFLIKKEVVANIALHEDVEFWRGVIGWTYEQNTGMAWSMFDGNPRLLSVFTGILLAAGVIYLILPVKRPFAYDIFIPLIIAGGLANFLDRIMRGYVVDYIKTLYVDFPVYNFADCLVTCGAAAFLLYLIYEIVLESRKEKTTKSEKEQNV